jgi:hypothetical protein
MNECNVNISSQASIHEILTVATGLVFRSAFWLDLRKLWGNMISSRREVPEHCGREGDALQLKPCYNPYKLCNPYLSQWTRPNPLHILLRVVRYMDCIYIYLHLSRMRRNVWNYKNNLQIKPSFTVWGPLSAPYHARPNTFCYLRSFLKRNTATGVKFMTEMIMKVLQSVI